MAYIRIWTHCVWGTKNKIPFLTINNKTSIIEHIKGNSKNKGIHIDCINGDKEHIHCLISLKHDQNISMVIQLIKGEASYWINKNKLSKVKFEWADEYFAVSVSESHVNQVRDYIKNQQEHHKKKTWIEEYKDFTGKYGFNTIKG